MLTYRLKDGSLINCSCIKEPYLSQIVNPGRAESISPSDDIVGLLRGEANVSEELHPGNSEIQVMRDAADEIERMRARHQDLLAAIGRFTSNA